MGLLTAEAMGAAGAGRGDMMGDSKAVPLRSPNSIVMSSRFLSSAMAGGYTGGVSYRRGYRNLEVGTRGQIGRLPNRAVNERR